MAAKPKAEAPSPDEDEDKDGGAEAAPAEPADAKKAGLVGRILKPVMGIARFANPLAWRRRERRAGVLRDGILQP